MNLILDVFEDYLATFEKTHGKAVDIRSRSQLALTEKLPRLFESYIQDSDYPIARYKFKGSYGQPPLNMTDTPWVAIFDSRVTSSAQKGYDIVLLFAKDMQSCVLSLNQGYKAFTDEFKIESLALKKVRQTAEKARSILPPVNGASYGPIFLQSKTSNAKGYELGAIASFTYHRNNLPPEKILKENFLSLLKAYDFLYNASGPNLLSLQSLTDSEFQAEVEMNLVNNDLQLSYDDDKPEPPPPALKNNSLVRYKRDVSKAREAIRRSDYACEIDNSHNSFISAVTNKLYLEAHHLIPMSAQGRYNVSLDVVQNIVSLCPNCHRMIHHGTHSTKAVVIKKLLDLRSESLAKKGVVITASELLSYYKHGIDETD